MGMKMVLADLPLIAVRSDRGMVRANNEDAVYADPVLGLAILADGMGGYAAGEVASMMAVSQLAAAFADLSRRDAISSVRTPDEIVQLMGSEIIAVNSAIYNLAKTAPQYSGMGTTLVLAWLHGESLHFAHVGDSRLYRWRTGVLAQLTSDHTLLQAQLDSGMITHEQARLADYRNLLTRAIGVGPWVDIDIGCCDVRSDDVFLLCSDGLTEMLCDDAIADLLLAGEDNLERLAEDLIRRANDLGGKDNISVILLGVGGDRGNWWQRLRARIA